MKAHQTEHIHKKYYVFSHTNGENIQYIHSSGEWVPDFILAHFYEDEGLALSLAKLWKKSGHPQENFVVGCVNVEVDPFYVMKVA